MILTMTTQSDHTFSQVPIYTPQRIRMMPATSNFTGYLKILFPANKQKPPGSRLYKMTVFQERDLL